MCVWQKSQNTIYIASREIDLISMHWLSFSCRQSFEEEFNKSKNFHHDLLEFLLVWGFLSHILTQEEYHIFMVVQLLIDIVAVYV